MLANGFIISLNILQLFLDSLKLHSIAMSFSSICLFLFFQLKCLFVMKDRE